jgi:hypothetical protein
MDERGHYTDEQPSKTPARNDGAAWNQNTMDAQARQRVTDSNLRFRSHRNARLASGVEEEWRESRALYYQDDDQGISGSWRSDAFVPHVTSQVHKILPHQVSALLEADQLLSVTPLNEANLQYAKVEEKCLYYQLTEKIKFELNWEIFCKACDIDGTSVAYIGWSQAWKKIKVENPQAQADGVVTDQYQDVPTDAHNTFLPLDISDIWVDVNAVPGQPLKRLFHYQRLTRRQMEQMGVFKHLDNLSPLPPSITEYLRQTIRATDPNSIGMMRENQSNDWMGMDPMDIPHHVITEWDDTTKTFSMMADDVVEILPPTPYPFNHGKMPFVFMHYEFCPGRFYSKGVPAFIAKSNRQANRLRRQKDDNVELAMNKMFLIRTGSILNEQEEMKWRPGGLVHVKGNLEQSVLPLEMGMVSQNAYMDERIIKDDIEDVSGITPAFSGQGDSESRTATGTISNRNQSQLRVNGIIRHSVIAAREIFQMMISNDQQFIAPMEKMHLVGQSALIYGLYTPEMSSGQVALRVNPAKLYDNSDIKNQQLINGLGMMGKMGLFQFLDQAKVARLFVNRILGIDDPSEIMADPMAGTVSDFMKAQARADAMAQTGQVIPPEPGENHMVAMQVFQKLAHINPELAPLMEQAIQMEQQALQEMNLAAAGMMAQGGPQGGEGGGFNPARQPAMTSATGAVRSSANVLAGPKAGANRQYAH